MKYKIGDIVEILNLSKSQIDDIQSQTNYCRTEKQLVSSIIGSRYRIYVYSPLGYQMEGWNHGGHTAQFFKEEQLVLYKDGNDL